MVAYTTTYSFAKPTVGDDEDVWGGYLNGNFDSIESLLKGTTALTAINVTGNITVGGTVDGRDVAADGTKLDGIESGATADQTKADIDALNIDADTVDGIQASSFLRSDANDSTSGVLTSTSDNTVTGGITVDSALNAYISADRGGTGYQAGYIWNTAGSANWYNYISTSSAELKWYTTSNVMTLTTSGSLSTTPQGTLWGSSNDGSGSGLDADTVDGIEASSFLRSDANDSYTGILTGGELAQGLHPVHTGYYGIWNTQAYSANSQNYMIINAGQDTYITGNDTVYIRGSDNSSTNQLAVTTSGTTIGGNTVWHAGNDGSGSGLDADTTDGYQASESSTASTLVARTSGGDISVRYGYSDYLYMGHGVGQRASDSVFFSSYDGFIRKNNATGFKDSLGLGTGDSPSFNNVAVAASVYHEGDTDTYLSFDTDAAYLATGGTTRLTVNSSGVRLGDTGNGYFQPVSGNYGSIQIDGGAHGGWEGYSIGGRAVFMHNNSTTTGIYNDVNNHWLFAADNGGAANLYYNGSNKIQTTNTGANIQGDLNAVDNIYVAGSLIHEGDTDTFINFQNNLIYFTAGNNSTLAVAQTYAQFTAPLYNYSVYYEDYDALSGTSVTVNCDTAQAFSLTMTGNTTFTFNSVSNAWSTGFVLELTGNGGTVTWPPSVDWAGGTAPDAPASGETDIYVFWTRDGGTTWYGVLSVDAAA